MTNYEKYADIINNFKGTGNFCKEFVEPYILKMSDCYDGGVHCGACHLRQSAWLMEEYKEPEVDWGNIAVDTPILAKDSEEDFWHKVHFAKYEDGEIYSWVGNGTSWTSNGYMSMWKFAKLPEDKNKK